MITKIDISNFRSIKQQSIPLKKLNILYGPNGSGKSSVMYAPYVIRNFLVKPNQRLNSLFNLGFINLGSFEDVVVNHQEYQTPEVYFHFKINDTKDKTGLNQVNIKEIKFGFGISQYSQMLEYFIVDNAENVININLPYSLEERKEISVDNNKILWNGVVFEKIAGQIAGSLTITFNRLCEEIKNIEVISVKRGFFNALFTSEFEEEESSFAMQIRNEGHDFEIKIDHYFKNIFNKNFRFVAIPGSASFYLKTHNSNGFATNLVNEGFGVNQTLYMLIKLLKKNTSLAFIEEPEIHLHPTAQKRLVDVFVEIIEKENKQIFLSTHSENIVSSVLAKIADGELNKDDVQFYLAKTENDETKIIPQDVNDKGQIEGGLMSFMETELSNLKTLLGL